VRSCPLCAAFTSRGLPVLLDSIFVSSASIGRRCCLSQLKCPAPRWGGTGGNAPSGADKFQWQVAIWLESPISRLPRVPRSASSHMGHRTSAT
jgi:hypothetical protein